VHGKAANDCEVEQVVQHEDSYRSNFCSYLQMRASIPTYWYQETSVTMPKPPILINRVDPDYRATEVTYAFPPFSRGDLVCASEVCLKMKMDMGSHFSNKNSLCVLFIFLFFILFDVFHACHCYRST
jgi:hypothetical protein